MLCPPDHRQHRDPEAQAAHHEGPQRGRRRPGLPGPDHGADLRQRHRRALAGRPRPGHHPRTACIWELVNSKTLRAAAAAWALFSLGWVGDCDFERLSRAGFERLWTERVIRRWLCLQGGGDERVHDVLQHLRARQVEPGHHPLPPRLGPAGHALQLQPLSRIPTAAVS